MYDANDRCLCDTEFIPPRYDLMSSRMSTINKQRPPKDRTYRGQSIESLYRPDERIKLGSARILCAGAGAGSLAALQFAQMRIGHLEPQEIKAFNRQRPRKGRESLQSGCIIIADPGTVTLRDLDRQAYNQTHLTHNKALSMVEIMNQKLHFSARAIPEGVTAVNADELLSQVEVVVEMIDISRVDIIYHLQTSAWKRGIPTVTGLDLGTGIEIIVFNPKVRGAMSWAEYTGLSDNFTLEQVQRIPAYPLVAQLIQGPVNKRFTTFEAALEYYNPKRFFSDANLATLLPKLPKRMQSAVGQLLNGEISHLPQLPGANSLLGVYQSQVVEALLLGETVKSAPEIIRHDPRRHILG
jgi:molybdopterin/thiamine biosynthesis adenylyltransferase